MLILRCEATQEEEIPHQNAALGVRATQWRQGIGDNEAFGLIYYGNGLDLDEQVFLEEALLKGRARRAWGLPALVMPLAAGVPPTSIPRA